MKAKPVRGESISDRQLLKICTCCEIEKTVTEFYFHKGGKYGVAAVCKSCKSEKQKKRYIENTERVLAINKRWKQAHPDEMKEIGRRGSKRRRGSPNGRLSQNIGAAISHVLKGQKTGRKWESILGYTTDQLRKHIEKQFTAGMSWENYGKNGWHIDHKIPRAVFNFETPEDLDFQRCWSLKNLQPMWARENIRKHAKITTPFQPSLTI